MVILTNADIMRAEEKRVERMLTNKRNETPEQQYERILDWCNDYNLGVFEDIKIEADNGEYDEFMRELYCRLHERLDELECEMYYANI